MSITRIAYGLEKPILYNNINAQSLYGALIEPGSVAKVGSSRRLLAGSFLASGSRLLPRAKTISPYTSGGTSVIVNNPSVFRVGDVLKIIGTPSSTPAQEAQAVQNATAANFGTVTGIIGGARQLTTVTPSAIAVGNVFTLVVEGASVSVTATTTSAPDVATALKAAIDSIRSQRSSLADIRITQSGDTLSLIHDYPEQVFETAGSVQQGSGTSTGILAIVIPQPVGAITITPAASNGNQVIGTKIGTITDIPLGVIAHDYYFTDDDGNDLNRDIAAYDSAMINRDALPYLDGHLVQVLPRLAFIPPYGA